MERYANLNLNSTWRFRVTLANGKTDRIENEVVGMSSIFGYDVYVIQQLDANDNLLGTYYIDQDMTDGFFIVGAKVGGQEEYEYDPPVPYLFRTFIPGKSYEVLFSTIDPNDEVVGTLIITKETAVVPAGTFTECYKSSFMVDVGGQLVTDEYWWAEDVGQVKHVEPNGNISELVTYIP